MLYTVDGLVKVAEETVNVSELAVGGGSGSRLHQVVGDHQPFLEADLENKDISHMHCYQAIAYSTGI